VADGVKQWPIWKTLLLFFVIILIGVPVVVAFQNAMSSNAGSSRAEWRELQASDGTDGMVVSTNGIDLLLYCGEQSPVAAMIRTRDSAFSLENTVLYRQQDGELSNLGGWACVPTLEACSTDGVDPSPASLLLHIAARSGDTETLTYTLEGGVTRRISYDFSVMRDRYLALTRRCTGSPN
jgi:hypothetical protein